MGSKLDKAKGHVKESVGKMTDDEELEREGERDQAAGTVKEKAKEAADKAKDATDAVKERAEKMVDKIRGKRNRK